LKVITPLVEPIPNSESSAPPVILNVIPSPSPSVAVTVVTAV